MADGSFVASHGSAVFTLEVGGQRSNQRFVVADLVSPAILGMDFMKANLDSVDVCEAHIWCTGQLFTPKRWFYKFNQLLRIRFYSCVKYHMVWLASSCEHSLPLAHLDGANATYVTYIS